MKFLYASLLLSIPSATYGFAGLTKPQSALRTKPLQMSWWSDFFGDRSDKEEEEEQQILDRIKKPVVSKIKDGMKELTDDEEDKYWEVQKDGIFGYVPDKDMTGVEPHMTQLCATLSEQLYSKKKFEDFKLSTKDHKTELIFYDNHGKFNEATPPFAAAISGDTLILGWRGTSGPADLLNDGAASPQSNFAWRKHAKTIKVQGAMTSIVQNDIVTHEADLIKLIKDRGIKEIVTTGQSLGGACSQIGHLTLRAQIQDEFSPWNEVEGVSIRSVAFCGPMTVALLDNATPETKKFLEEMNANSCNMIFKNDVVPRAYGYLSFIEDFVDDAIPDLSKNIPVPRVAKAMFDVRGKLEDLVDDAKGNEAVAGFLKFLSFYRHLGNQIYYETEDAKPRVLRDMGAYYKNSKKDDDVLRDVKYKPVDSPLSEFMDWHMRIIRGPGLSYPEDQLS